MEQPMMKDPNELITTKRIINHRTKQIETRVQRQIVMEDGVVISDTGPLVTTKTLEDSKEEVDEQVEHVKYSSSYCPHHHQWPVHNKDSFGPHSQRTQTPVETVKSNPMKTFVFGEGEKSTSSASTSPPPTEPSKRPQLYTDNKTTETKQPYKKPSKTFYFGQQNITDDCKEKENLQQLIKSSTSADHSCKGKRSISKTGNEEKDCQFVYEYSDFSKCG